MTFRFIFVISQTDILPGTRPRGSPRARAASEAAWHVLARGVRRPSVSPTPECQKRVFRVSGEAAGADASLRVEEM